MPAPDAPETGAGAVRATEPRHPLAVSPVARPFRLPRRGGPPRLHTTLTSAGDALIALTGELDLSGAPRRSTRRSTGWPSEDGRAPGRARPARARVHGLERAADGRARRAPAARPRSASWCWSAAPETVQRVFEITRMDEHLHVRGRARPARRRRGGGMTIDVELPSTAVGARARPRRARPDRRPDRARADARRPPARLRARDQRRPPRGRRGGAARGRARRARTCGSRSTTRATGFELEPPPDDPLRASGWGLVLVEELADRWGVDHDPRTRVWFEMDVGGFRLRLRLGLRGLLGLLRGATSSCPPRRP